MNDNRTLTRVAWSIFAFAALLLLVGFAFSVWNRSGDTVLIAFLLFPAVGAPVASRQPRNPIGWILLAIGVVWGLYAVLNGYAVHALEVDPGSLPRPDLVLALNSWTWLPAVGLMGSFLLLLFPDGRLPSPKWRPVAIASAVAMIVGSIATLITPGPFSNAGFSNVHNPLGIEVLRDALTVVNVLTVVLLLASITGAAISVIIRFRRSGGLERLQLKWLAAGAAITALAYLTLMGSSALVHLSGETSTPLWTKVFEQVGVASFLLIPIAMGIAILKYRLYDIDVVINKTLVFGALAAFITGIYVAVVVGIGSLLGSSDEPNLALSIAATAVVAIAFQPVKARVQRVANRIVYGQRATPYEVMANLSRAASGAVEPHDILPSVAAVAASGVGARATRVKLLLHSGHTLEASFPEGADSRVPYDVVVPLTHRDERVGELAVAKAAGEQLGPGDRKLLEDLAAQAALSLHNARLAIELGARLDEISAQARELDASRRRIVSAQDDSRRRLEADISSGPQRSLAEMRSELAAIKEVVERDPQRAAGLLAALAGRANQTLDALRDMARGIFPPLLADKGIVAALEAHIRKHELDVKLRYDDGLRDRRFDERVEIAVYFCCLEALNARRDGTTISLRERNGVIEMRCTEVMLDDARSETIRDRVEALSGTVELEGRGEGSEVRASFPAGVLELAK